MAEKLATCPACGGDVVENQKGFGCANWKKEDGACPFVIWKNFYDKKITSAQAKTLIQKGETSKIKGWVSRNTQKEFDAKLQLEEESDGSYRVKFLFDDN